MQLLAIVAMLVAIGSVMFALQNNVPVTITFIVWRFDGSLAMVLLMALALGGIAVALISTPATLRRQWAISRQNKRIDELEKARQGLMDEVADLRRRVPADQPEAAVPPPYVGLKQLIVGRDEGGSGAAASSAARGTPEPPA